MQNPKATKDAKTRADLLRAAEEKLREALSGEKGEAMALPTPVMEAAPEDAAGRSKASCGSGGVAVGLPVRFDAAGEVVADAC
eukprot:12761657-Alexandrium_andersonii.AAC.1